MITVILVEDHQVVREALRLLLNTQSDFQILAETGDGVEALRLVETQKPDILILDLTLVGLSGLEVAGRTNRLSPRTKVVVLSMHEAESYVVEALRAGVAGYVLKKSSSEDLIFAVRQALAGNIYLSPMLNERAIQAYLEYSRSMRTDDPHEMLTPREREIMHLAVEGLSNPQIAARLTISARTVEMHRGNLMKKLGLKTQTELVKYAVRRGLV
jgi:DNA-binding NarL/FixJ family response regulator